MFEALRKKIDKFIEKFDDKRAGEMFRDCFFSTIDTTCEFLDDGSVFMLTGDIPAMWLRDSSAQVFQYLHFCDDEDVCSLIRGLLKRQMALINIDPYANAFMLNEEKTSEWNGKMKTDKLPKIVWERKFELDSLCYPFVLAAKYYALTKDVTIFTDSFKQAFDKTIETITNEINHSEKSTYYYRCNKSKTSKPDPKGEKGLVWCGFRPSDDACKYNYHIPDNMFLVAMLSEMCKVFEDIGDDIRRENSMHLVMLLRTAIETYGVKNVKKYGKIYAAETNCRGKYMFNDDANVPSLLSIPYLEYPFIDDDIYESTRRYVLSRKNKYYYSGKVLKGIGSPHTKKGYVWPIAIAMQGITSKDDAEIKSCFNMLINSDAGTGRMHESVNKNKTSKYSRSWFAWADSMFADFVLRKKDILLKK